MATQFIIRDGGLPTRHLYSDEAEGSVRSLSARGRTRIKFTNSTWPPVAVRVSWIDYDSHERPYGIIAPGETRLLYSFLTHAWAFASEEPDSVPHSFLNVNGKPVAFPCSTRQHAVITVAAPLPWSTATHRASFGSQADFCRSVRALLLCHRRLQEGGGSGGGGDARPSPPSPSLLPVPSEAYQRSGAAAATSRGASPTSRTTLGDLPHDVLLEIVAALAPAVPDLLPLVHKDMELPPPPSRTPTMAHLLSAQQALGGSYTIDHPHTREFSFWVANKVALQAHQQAAQHGHQLAMLQLQQQHQQAFHLQQHQLQLMHQQQQQAAVQQLQHQQVGAVLQLNAAAQYLAQLQPPAPPQQPQQPPPADGQRTSPRGSVTQRILSSIFPGWSSSRTGHHHHPPPPPPPAA